MKLANLLKRESDGELTLSEATGHIPNYAILSHRWAKNQSDEVTFQDLKAGIGKENLAMKSFDSALNRQKLISSNTFG